jgi:hypothetical protein
MRGHGDGTVAVGARRAVAHPPKSRGFLAGELGQGEQAGWVEAFRLCRGKRKKWRGGPPGEKGKLEEKKSKGAAWAGWGCGANRGFGFENLF